jgi:hypothetical protein
MADERLLHRMQAAGGRQPFDGGRLPILALGRERQARQHALAVEQHRTGAARALVAALLRAGQLELVAQRVEQRDAAVRPHAPLSPVDPQRHIHMPVGRNCHGLPFAVVGRPAKTT